jgi:hypothetical protein
MRLGLVMNPFEAEYFPPPLFDPIPQRYEIETASPAPDDQGRRTGSIW